MNKELIEYHQKRNFKKTLEPQGETDHNGQDLRYVIQHHYARRNHYDFRLEWQGVMLSWAIPKGPSYNPNDKRLAIMVENHPLEYRNFEGNIPKGEYGGGSVMIWDEGHWQPYNNNVNDSLLQGILKFTLEGIRLKGKWALIKIGEEESKANWLLIKEKDEFSKTESIIDKFTTSVRTNRTMEEIAKNITEELPKNPFSSIDVQLAQYSNTIPQGNDWLFELKYDGYRIISFIEKNTARLVSRNNKDYTNQFRDIANSLINIANGKALVLDGELTVSDANGKISFQALQNYLSKTDKQNLIYFVFDILALNGRDLRNLPLIERKNILNDIMKNNPQNLYYSTHFLGKGDTCFTQACQVGLEGIIAKEIHSIYSGKRNNNWLKIKCIKRQEFVIGGFTISDKKLNSLSSLLLGAYQNNQLIYYGRVGTGFSQTMITNLKTQFDTIKTNVCPFTSKIERRVNEEIIWLKPVLVAEIKYTEITQSNLLRHASFQGLRQDKNAKEVILEKDDNKKQEVDIIKTNQQHNVTSILKDIKITNPDKIIFSNPLLNKMDIIQYYTYVAPKMLPYVGNRILSVVRCPKGISESCFYKKHPLPNSKGIIPITLDKSSEKNTEYFYINDIVGLLNEVQMGSLEFHTWQSSVPNIENPDTMVFDLDPYEGMNLQQVHQGVKDLKSILDELALQSFLKTSGGKGYHIVIPFAPKSNWDTFYNFAKQIAQLMEARWPNLYTSNMRKDNRINKIFIDWVRNGRGATSIAPYSLRARQGATVSMPIAWQELETISPNAITMIDALNRLNQEDPWSTFFSLNQTLA